jgi:hypothetical protein
MTSKRQHEMLLAARGYRMGWDAAKARVEEMVSGGMSAREILARL